MKITKWRAHRLSWSNRDYLSLARARPWTTLSETSSSTNGPLDLAQTQRPCNAHFGWPVVFAMSTARILTWVWSVSTFEARMSGGML